jgi:hypothetical protein
MLFLGEKIIRDTGVSLVHIGTSVLKVAITSTANKRLSNEISSFYRAKNDPFFSNYVIPFKAFPRIIVMPYCSNDVSRFDIEKYFFDFFCHNKNNDIMRIKHLIYYTALENSIYRHGGENIKNIVDFINHLTSLSSFIHGDFHSKNIVYYKNTPVFLDFSYRLGSPYFDLLHYYIFSNIFGKENGKWISEATSIFNNSISKIFGIPITLHEKVNYIIYYISSALHFTDVRKSKQEQYIELVKLCMDLWQSEYSTQIPNQRIDVAY